MGNTTWRKTGDMVDARDEIRPVLIAGQWRAANATSTFVSENPTTGEPLPGRFPVSAWADCEAALTAAAIAAEQLAVISSEQIAEALTRLADRLTAQADQLVATAHAETALAVKPRLADVELPRTVGQLRQAAAAAVERSWCQATIDTALGIRSCLLPLGPVGVFGPNNFPFAFGSASGGDFAAALAAGNPVIAKANTSHPHTTELLAREVFQAVQAAGLPAATVQLIYRTSHADGRRLVADQRLGATAYTGSRAAGLELKSAADAAGKPIYLELSSINPLVLLPGAVAERGDALREEFLASCLMGTGQFCTNPGLLLCLAGEATERFLAAVARGFAAAPVGTLLSTGVAQSLAAAILALRAAGATCLSGGEPGGGAGASYGNTLLRIEAAGFLARAEALQTEAFGNAALAVVARDEEELLAVIRSLEGNLTGTIYSSTTGTDDALYRRVEPLLRRRVGRLLNDKMPTGVAVSPAMNHGGPYPATGHPGFTAVGIPAAMRRFAMLACYDAVRSERLPAVLRDANPTGRTWRLIDGNWTQADVTPR